MCWTSHARELHRPHRQHDAASERLASVACMVFELEEAGSEAACDTMAAQNPEKALEEVIEKLELATRQSSMFGRQLCRDVQDLLTGVQGEIDTAKRLPVLLAGLARFRYDVRIRQALGGGNACFRSLRHEFILVRGSGEFSGMEFIVEPALRQHFAIPHPSPEYSAALSHVPEVFVGGSCRLVPVVQLLCALMADSFERQGLALPPWRKEQAMLSKWLPSTGRFRDIPPHQLRTSTAGELSLATPFEPSTPQRFSSSRGGSIEAAATAAAGSLSSSQLLLAELATSGLNSPIPARRSDLDGGNTQAQHPCTQLFSDVLFTPSPPEAATFCCSTPALAITGFKLLDSHEDIPAAATTAASATFATSNWPLEAGHPIACSIGGSAAADMPAAAATAVDSTAFVVPRGTTTGPSSSLTRSLSLPLGCGDGAHSPLTASFLSPFFSQPGVCAEEEGEEEDGDSEDAEGAALIHAAGGPGLWSSYRPTATGMTPHLCDTTGAPTTELLLSTIRAAREKDEAAAASAAASGSAATGGEVEQLRPRGVIAMGAMASSGAGAEGNARQPLQQPLRPVVETLAGVHPSGPSIHVVRMGGGWPTAPLVPLLPTMRPVPQQQQRLGAQELPQQLQQQQPQRDQQGRVQPAVASGGGFRKPSEALHERPQERLVTREGSFQSWAVRAQR
ncbi:hypothetical protein Agub_g6304 [Astrephomene gubernaculifera]|uniref:Uncharacterized protein n=1 Tax=Astrephomene gubernaculifera TaxID=47775 RepID=A0AAD3DNA1_9CHLO|nr:hypothetical protein Agub_g6304 [Astrephomene gubernaculifera]